MVWANIESPTPCCSGSSRTLYDEKSCVHSCYRLPCKVCPIRSVGRASVHDADAHFWSDGAPVEGFFDQLSEHHERDHHLYGLHLPSSVQQFCIDRDETHTRLHPHRTHFDLSGLQRRDNAAQGNQTYTVADQTMGASP